MFSTLSLQDTFVVFRMHFQTDFFLQQVKQVLQFKLHQVVSMIKTAK